MIVIIVMNYQRTTVLLDVSTQTPVTLIQMQLMMMAHVFLLMVFVKHVKKEKLLTTISIMMASVT